MIYIGRFAFYSNPLHFPPDCSVGLLLYFYLLRIELLTMFLINGSVAGA